MSAQEPLDCDPHRVAYVEHMMQPAYANGATRLGRRFSRRSVFNPTQPSEARDDRFGEKIAKLVEAFRHAGHRAARIDPLDSREPDETALRLERERLLARAFGDEGDAAYGKKRGSTNDD